MFVCFAAMAFAAWTALVLSFAAFDPLGLVRTPNNVRSSDGPTHLITAILSAQPGPAGPLARPEMLAEADPPNFTHVRYNPRSGRAMFAGRGQPEARIAILNAGKVVLYASVGRDGKWLAAANFESIEAPLTLTIEQRSPLTGDLIVGGALNLHLPKRFRRSVSVAEPARDATGEGFRLVAVKAESDSLGPAASRAFERLLTDEEATDRDDARPKLAGAWEWLDNANRSYQDEVVTRLRRGGGFAGAVPRENVGGAGDNAPRNAVGPDGATAAGDESLANRRLAVNEAAPDDASRSGLSGSIAEWFRAARQSYETEIIPRLSGEVPRAIRLREQDEAERRAEEERQRREAREARLREQAAERAERERIEAERRRREAEQRRLEAEAEARRIAEEKARLDREAAERARLAEEERRRREAERVAERERAAAERAERERLAALEAERVQQAEAARRAAEAAERAEAERLRREALARERAASEREAAARERLAAERLAAERRAAAERRREAEARRAAEEEEERRRAEALEEEARRQRLIAEAELIRRRREAEQRRRLAELSTAREAARQRLVRRPTREEVTPVEIKLVPPLPTRQRPPAPEPPLPEPPLPERLLVSRDTFTRRNTTIRITTPQIVTPDDSSASRTRPTRQLASLKDAQPKRATRTARVSRKRRARVQSYRRRLAPRRAARCQQRAGQRITPPGTYVVQPGDSLWRIARRHYRRGTLYPVIFRANRKKIRVARLIYPCQRFHLPKLRFR